MAILARQQTKSGDAVTGMLLALEALPKSFDPPDRPIVGEAAGALIEAMVEQRERVILRGHESFITSAEFSSDGTKILTASEDGTASIWDAANGRELVHLSHKKPVYWAGFSPDGGRVLTGAGNEPLRVWDSATGALLFILGDEKDIHYRGQESVFSPDGRRLLTTGHEDGHARVWDAETGAELFVFRRFEGQPDSIAFSDDGERLITGSGDGTARIWDTRTGQQLEVLHGHEREVYAVTFNPAGDRAATISFDQTARIWDIESGRALAVLPGHVPGFGSLWFANVAFNLDGTKLLTATASIPTRLWSVEDPTEQFAQRCSGEAELTAAEFSPYGASMLTACDDGIIFLHDVERNKRLAVLRDPDDSAGTAAFAPDGTKLVTVSRYVARVWDVHSFSDSKVLRFITPDSLSFSPDGKWVLINKGHDRVSKWDWETGKETDYEDSYRSLSTDYYHQVYVSALSPDGRRVVQGWSDGVVRVTDFSTGREIAILKGHDGGVSSVAFSPDGSRVVTGSHDDTALIWDMANPEAQVRLIGHHDAVKAAVFSPDGAKVITGSADNSAMVWDSRSGALLAVLAGHEDELISVAFNPDGDMVATASRDKTARTWDVTTSEPVAVFCNHAGPVFFSAFSPDGRRVMTGSNDESARVWNSITGEEIVVLRGNGYSTLSGAFSPDGTKLATGGADFTVRIWPIFRSLEELVSKARRSLPRQLTDEDRSHFSLQPSTHR